jgi:hypothetical protein
MTFQRPSNRIYSFPTLFQQASNTYSNGLPALPTGVCSNPPYPPSVGTRLRAQSSSQQRRLSARLRWKLRRSKPPYGTLLQFEQTGTFAT